MTSVSVNMYFMHNYFLTKRRIFINVGSVSDGPKSL